nr:MAG: hypothetical protein [Bacteriophage sp.]
MAKKVQIRILRHYQRGDSAYLLAVRDTTVDRVYPATRLTAKESAKRFGFIDEGDPDAAGGGWLFHDDVGDEVYAYVNAHQGVTIEEVVA